MGEDDYVPRTIPGLDYHTATYWVAVLQIIVYSLAVIWLARNLMHRGFWHTAGVSVKGMGNTP